MALSFGQMSKQVKGIVLIAVGVVLLLNKLGILRQGLDFYVVIFIALYLIAAGLMKLDGIQKLQRFIKKDQ